MGKAIFIFLGSLFLALAVVGVSLPGLPTTPFLLLSASCYCKSSKRLYNWLLNHKLFGPMIRDYREHKAITVKTKIVALITMWLMVTFSLTLFISGLYLRIVILILAGLGTFCMARIPTYKPMGSTHE